MLVKVTETLAIEQEILSYFNNFLKLNDKHISGNKEIPKTKALKIMFIDKFIVNNKLFFKQDVQLCTTNIAKVLNVKAQTVMNWIKDLCRLGFIVCSNTYYRKGYTARKYRMIKDSLKDFVNKFNGHYEKFKQNIDKSNKKKKMREERWSGIHAITSTYKEKCFVAQAYLGCFDSFAKDVKNMVGKDVLMGPSEFDSKKTQAYEWLEAFRFINKSNKFKNNVTFEQEEKFYSMYGEELIVGNQLTALAIKFKRIFDISPKGSKQRRRANWIYRQIKVRVKGIEYDKQENSRDIERNRARISEVSLNGQEAYC